MEKPERFWLGIAGELAGLGLGVLLLRPHWPDPVTGRWVACPCWHSALLPFVERRLCPLGCVSSWKIQGGIWRLSGDWIWGVVDLLWPRHHLEAAHTLLVGRLCSFVVFHPYDPGLLRNFCGVKEYQSQQIRILLFVFYLIQESDSGTKLAPYHFHSSQWTSVHWVSSSVTTSQMKSVWRKAECK